MAEGRIAKLASILKRVVPNHFHPRQPKCLPCTEHGKCRGLGRFGFCHMNPGRVAAEPDGVNAVGFILADFGGRGFGQAAGELAE
jgi:hypothetical protein